MDNSYIKLFVDCLEKYQKLSDAEFGRLVRAGLYYQKTGGEPDLTGREVLLWDGMKLDIDRAQKSYNATCAARSEAGKRGAESRWQNGKNGNCHICHNDDGKNGKEKEKEEEKDEVKNKKNIPPNPPKGFERFWSAYPLKVGKQAALRSFKRVKVPVDVLIEAVEAQQKSEQWTRDNGRFIPHPATWLNQGRWEDDLRDVSRDHAGDSHKRWNIVYDIDGTGGE